MIEMSNDLWEKVMEKPKYIGIVTLEGGEQTIGWYPDVSLEKMKVWRDEHKGCIDVEDCKIYRIEEV